MKVNDKVTYKNRIDKTKVYTIHYITEDKKLAGIFSEKHPNILIPVKIKNLKLYK